MQISFNHIALLLPSVDRAADACRALSLPVGPAEHFAKEGTREIYVGDAAVHGGRLLLIEAAGAGPYGHAFKKRGAGLHHLAVDVEDIEAFIESISGSGWLLHPTSLKTIAASRTAWLARPGAPALIEVQERKAWQNKPALVTVITMHALTPAHKNMFHAIGLTQVDDGDVLTLQIGDKKLTLDALL